MTTFVYSAKMPDGDVRSGEIQAVSLAQASAALRRQQIIPTSINQKKAGFALGDIKIPSFGGGVKTKELVIFSRQFATMIDAGLPLVQCLDILSSQQPNPEFKKVLLDVKNTVEGGATFADSLRKHPKVFDDLYVNLIAAGEVGGILDTILNRLSGFLEKSEKLKGKIKSAMTYPTAVIIIACLVVSGLLIWVVPIFQDMFSSFGKALPLPTQMVVNMSDALKHYWYVIFGSIGGFIFALTRIYKTHKGRRAMDALFLKLRCSGTSSERPRWPGSPDARHDESQAACRYSSPRR